MTTSGLMRESKLVSDADAREPWFAGADFVPRNFVLSRIDLAGPIRIAQLSGSTLTIEPP
jgi:hypothetical protein